MTDTAGERPSACWAPGGWATAIALRLIGAGHRLVVWNRTPAKAQRWSSGGRAGRGRSVSWPRCPVVFVSVSTSDDLIAVLDPAAGLLAPGRRPDAGHHCGLFHRVGRCLRRRPGAVRPAGVAFLAAPISGKPGGRRSRPGLRRRLRPAETFRAGRAVPARRRAGGRTGGDARAEPPGQARPQPLPRGAGQVLVEVTTFAEKAGTDRLAFLGFPGNTIVGSEWLRQRTPPWWPGTGRPRSPLCCCARTSTSVWPRP